MQMKNERELRKLGTESRPNSSNEGGGNRKSSIYSKLLATAVVEEITNFIKFSPLLKIQLFPKIVILQIVTNFFINSAEDSTNVIIKNDQNEDADHPKLEN